MEEELYEQFSKEPGASNEEKAKALDLLAKLLQNIVRERSNPKYRIIKKENKIISSQLLLSNRPPSRLLSTVLTSLGFYEDSFKFELPLTLDERYTDFDRLHHAAELATAFAASLRASVDLPADSKVHAPSAPAFPQLDGADEPDDALPHPPAAAVHPPPPASACGGSDEAKDSGSEAKETPRSGPGGASSGGFRRRERLDDKVKEVSADLARLRKEKALEYQRTEGVQQVARNTSMDELSAERTSRTNGTSQGGLWSSFTGMFGGSSSSTTSRREVRQRRGKTMTLADLPKPRGGG